MRPLASSSFSIDGMLLFTFVSRRAPQKPEPIVTACTGMLCNLAKGDLLRKRTPSSFQAGADPSAADSILKLSKVLNGMALTVAAEMADPTNSRREICVSSVMPFFLLCDVILRSLLKVGTYCDHRRKLSHPGKRFHKLLTRRALPSLHPPILQFLISWSCRAGSRYRLWSLNW